MGALGCTQRTRGSRRVGSTLEWQGGRRVSAHVQPARNFQGVSSAPGSAQHEQSVQDVSFASGRRPQLRTRHVQVRSMDAAGRMYPLHLDAGTARRWACRPSRLYPAGPGSDSTWRGRRDGVRNDGRWKGRNDGTGSTRHVAADAMRCGVTACGRGGAVALGTLRETWHGR